MQKNGLLVSGVLVGQALLEAAKVNKQTTNFQSYKSAHEIFKSKYNCIPGDCPFVTRFIDNSECVQGNAYYGSNCNGNGNGRIEWADYISRFEAAFYWQQMFQTKILKQCEYSTPLEKTYCLGPFERGITFAAYGNVHGLPTTGFPQKNYLWLSRSWGAYLLTPEITRKLDEKLDDGKPITGIVTGIEFTTNIGNCISGTEYNLSNNNISCTLLYNLE